QQAGDDLVEVGAVVAHRRAQAVQHRVEQAVAGQVLLDGHHAALAALHVAGDVALVEAAFDGEDLRPGLAVLAGEQVFGVLDKQRVDVDHVALDLQVVRAATELDQGAGNDVDEAPGEFPKGRRVALGAELAGDARGYLGDATEAADGVVAAGDVRPAQVKDIELALAAGTARLDVHALEQVGVALGIEDDAHLAAVNVLGDVQLGQAGLADPGGA